MLINLSINNVAVIEKADVEFNRGFNVLTGETGAGKSILIDALSMVLGMRTSRDLIRAGASASSVSAVFSNPPDLSDLDISPEEDDCIYLSRKLSADGKNICKINAQTVPLSLLKQVGERLVSIHGQHDNIALLKPSFHISLLDEYAGLSNLIDQYQSAYKDYFASREKLESMKISESEREQQKDILNFRITEIKNVNPQPGEDDTLSEKRDALRNYSSIMAFLESASDALSSQGGAKDALYSAMRNMQSASGMDKTLSSFEQSLTDLYYTAEDIASEINSYVSKMSFSPGELDEIEERLDLITRLKKKYGPEIENCLSNLEIWEQELESLTFYDDTILKIEKEVLEKEKAMLSLGDLLHEERVKSAKILCQAVEEELSFLDMPRVRFSVSFTEHEPSLTGLFSAEFMISTNPSEDLKPLSKIASGGEMSRIMLALKTALSNCDDVGTLLFDEIDSGVSGKAALKIAEKLKNLARNRQIICITHLPQMASKAHSHLLVSKDTSLDFFTTKVIELDYAGRVKELSRLINGDENSSASLLAAEEMLKNNS